MYYKNIKNLRYYLRFLEIYKLKEHSRWTIKLAEKVKSSPL